MSKEGMLFYQGRNGTFKGTVTRKQLKAYNQSQYNTFYAPVMRQNPKAARAAWARKSSEYNEYLRNRYRR